MHCSHVAESSASVLISGDFFSWITAMTKQRMEEKMILFIHLTSVFSMAVKPVVLAQCETSRIVFLGRLSTYFFPVAT